MDFFLVQGNGEVTPSFTSETPLPSAIAAFYTYDLVHQLIGKTSSHGGGVHRKRWVLK